jgi:hypothetical protein
MAGDPMHGYHRLALTVEETTAARIVVAEM